MSQSGLNKQNKSVQKSCFQKEASEHLPDSAEYLKKLEAKLSHLSGRNKEPAAKEMLSLLQAGKEDFMNNLIKANSNVVCSSFLPEINCDDKEVSQSYLERKLFPEKTAVSNEELQHLLEADVLSKFSENPLNLDVDR